MRFICRTITALTMALAVTGMATQAGSANPDKQDLKTSALFFGAETPWAFSDALKTSSVQEMTTAWLDAQPKASGGNEWRCLAEALYFEARGETVMGQFAVAEVIMNRVESQRFPTSACKVINQGTGKKYQCQFTYTCDGLKEVIAEPRAWDRVSKVARAVLDGRAPQLTDGATHYHTTAVNPKWSRVYTRTAEIGVHIFYRHTWRTASN